MNKTTRDYITKNRNLILQVATQQDRRYLSLLRTSVLRAIAIIDYFEEFPGTTIDDAAADLEMHRSTLQEFVTALDLERLSSDKTTPKGGRPKTSVR